MAATPEAVYEAVADPNQLSRYFTSSASGRLDGSAAVHWRWDDACADAVVRPVAAERPHRIVFSWQTHGRDTEVTFTFQGTTDRTRVRVVESGWPVDEAGAAALADQTGGWVNMLCCLKAYLEHGINLREGLV